MKRFSVISVSDPRWSEIISLCRQYDFYHTQSYSRLEGDASTLLFVVFQGKDFIAIPLTIRGIEGTDFFDCTSVYGYCGPVSNLYFENLQNDHILFFQSELLNFFKERNIISAFSRLHPFFNQPVVLNKFGFIREVNNTVAIDLQLSEDDRIKRYRKSTRSEINRLRNKGFTVTEAITQEEINEFVHIYNNNMRRLEAPQSYFYDHNYFYQFLNSPHFRTKLLVTRRDDKITAGALFTLTNRIMQYHLSCSEKGDDKSSPMKLILDHACRIGRENNMDFLHLGGGVNGSSSDSLFKFKAGFSDIRFVFSTWQLIVDEDIYSYLIDFFNIDRKKVTNFFPVYRTE